jgi:hypothetical protein
VKDLYTENCKMMLKKTQVNEKAWIHGL